MCVCGGGGGGGGDINISEPISTDESLPFHRRTEVIS